MSDVQTSPLGAPWPHDLSITVDGPRSVVSSRTGDLEADSPHGLYVDDRRVLERLEVRVGSGGLTPTSDGAIGARARYVGTAHGVGEADAKSTVEVVRLRVLGADPDAVPGASLTERITVTSHDSQTVATWVRVVVGSDGLDVALVESGQVIGTPLVPIVDDHHGVTFADAWHETRVVQTPAPSSVVVRDAHAVLETDLVLRPGESASIVIGVTCTRRQPSAFDADAGASGVDWSALDVSAGDHRLVSTISHAVVDLQHLLLRDPLDPRDVVAAAGAPWTLTLVGRDALWAARMTLPLGVELAHGTLRALARRQGRVTDPATGEEPGKILHRTGRHGVLDPSSGVSWPPLSYGSVDATALWVIVLGEARQWGLADHHVVELVPTLEAAVDWLLGHGRSGGDGLIRSTAATPVPGTNAADAVAAGVMTDVGGAGGVVEVGGLDAGRVVEVAAAAAGDQGWKDSSDAIRWRDGRVAQGSVALVEAQAYAVEALRVAAGLYRDFGIAGADEVEQAGEQIAQQVRERFWVGGNDEHYLAMALDGSGAAVDGLGSNMGRALGTGTLTREESAEVVATLMGEELLDPFGIRTLGTINGGFSPIGIHTGSIWTHDTAIIAWNMARAGFTGEAAVLVRSLVAAAEAFDYRWPAHYSGLSSGGRPGLHPEADRPRSTSAASALLVLQIVLGLSVDAPENQIRLDPPKPPPFGALDVTGLLFRGHPFRVTVDEHGVADAEGVASEVAVDGR